MPYKFFTKSRTSWQAMFEEMNRAKYSIYLEMYIFADGMTEFDFVRILQKKAEEGLKIKIILDSFGSRELTSEAIGGLRKSGAEVIFFSQFLHRAHRKLLIVDERVAFVGGVNLHPPTRKWKDLMVEIKGKLVKSMVRSFAKSYVYGGGKDNELNNLKKEIIINKARTWLIEHFPGRNKHSLKRIYIDACLKAEKNLLLVTPYFVPRRWLVGALHQAVIRGVKVEVLVPRATDHFIVDPMNYFYMSKLADLGITFYLGIQMNHAKAVIIDKEEAVVGSQNLDPVSFDFNSEIGVFIKDRAAVEQLLTITNEWKKESTLFNPDTYKSKWTDYILWPLLRLLFFV